MRVLVFLTCISAIAHAQFGNPQYKSSFGQDLGFTNSRVQLQQNNGFGFQKNSRGQVQYQSSQNQYQPQYQQNQFQQTRYQQNQNQQNQYQQNQFQQQKSTPALNPGTCREKNERYPMSGSCDRYIECIDGVPEERLCPDGLRFNSNVTFEVYPCQYPADVPCLERSALQPAQPTEECPNQFAYLRLGDASNCGTYRSCVNGRAYDFNCPEGLAFDLTSYRCEWPDLVADCDAEAYLGVRCPDIPTNELGPPAGYRYIRSNDNCQKYFFCIDGRPRLLGCGGASAFDENSSSCVPADEVSSCPAELRTRAAQIKDEEQKRQAKHAQFASSSRQTNRNF